MQLKLAEYNAEGKFERFLELGKDFGYFGNEIFLLQVFGAPSTVMQTFTLANWFNGDDRFDVVQKALNQSIIKKDEKDPLNRFNGSFDGRTYGDGRFVMIKDDEDDIFKCFDPGWTWYRRRGDVEPSELTNYDNGGCGDDEYRICDSLGNLHSNPELWKKLK